MTRIIKTQIYDNFICIADRCSFSCCKSWEIAIDQTVYGMWEKDDKLADLIRSGQSGSFIKLNEHKTCPFLDNKELCSLILTGREEYLTQVCRSFPRVVNCYEDGVEYSLSSACPEVVDMLHQLADSGAIRDNCTGNTDTEGTRVREAMLFLIRNNAFSVKDRILLIFHMLLVLKEKPEETVQIIGIYRDVQFLKSILDGLKQLSYPLEDTIDETNELLLDIIENYHKEPGYRDYLKDIRTRARFYESSKQSRYSGWTDFIDNYHAYESLNSEVLAQKIFGEGPDFGIEDILLSFQKIVTEYILVRYSVFLKSLDREINYQNVRDYIVVYSRIIGYNPDGMSEFWQDSFDDATWELGYLILLIG